MSDLFHRDVPVEFIESVFDVMKRASWHRFQVLTKRSDRLVELAQRLPWPDSVWMGVTVESSDYTYRIDHLRATAAKVKFLSLEPLLGPLPELDLSNIDWVIVGGESGHGARPMDEAWVLGIRDQCLGAGVPFFFKQWGGVNKKRAGRLLEGRTWNEMPTMDFSRLSRDEIDSLAEDIKSDGQQHPIVLADAMTLDGHSRSLVCAKLLANAEGRRSEEDR